MENSLRYAFYAKLQAFADVHDIKIVWPDTPDDDETEDEDGIYINSDVENDDIFFRPQINQVAAPPIGIKTGFQKYVWICQVSIYTRNQSDPFIARHIDLLREEFPFNTKMEHDIHKYITQTNVTARPTFSVSSYRVTPCLFQAFSIR